jgi:predicted NBD/HSP70 family sugar kinase
MNQDAPPHGTAAKVSGDQRMVRQHNLAAVARLVRSGTGHTRRDVGELLNLNKVTVSSLVGELIDRGLLEQNVPDDARGVGRPSAVLSVDETRHLAIVVELLPSTVTVTTWSLSLSERSSRTIAISPTELGPARTISRVATELRRTLARADDSGQQVVGVVVALPGVIESDAGHVRLSGPLGWHDVALRDRLMARVGAECPPVRIERAANMATVAEWRNLPGCSSLIYLDEGSAGLGVGVVVEDRLLSGHRGRAGELLFSSSNLAAKFRLDDLGLDALLRRTDNGTDFIGASPTSTAKPASSTPAIGQALTAKTRAAVDRLAESVADYLSTLVALLDPELVLLGGHFTTLAPHLGPTLRRSLDARLSRVWQTEIPIHFGVYGPRAARLGAATVAADQEFGRLSN